MGGEEQGGWGDGVRWRWRRGCIAVVCLRGLRRALLLLEMVIVAGTYSTTRLIVMLVVVL